MKNTIFYKSWKKLDVNIVKAMVFDFASLIIFAVIAGLYYFMFGYLSDRAVFETKEMFYIVISILTIIAVALIAINSAFFKKLVYEHTTRRKIPFKTHLKFSLHWVVPWFTFFIFIIIKKVNPFAIAIFFLFYLIITPIARLNMEEKTTNTLKKTFETLFDFKILGHFLLMFAVLWIKIFVASIFYTISEQLFYIVFIVLILFFAAWARHYLNLYLLSSKTLRKN
jgi:MFS family permease